MSVIRGAFWQTLSLSCWMLTASVLALIACGLSGIARGDELIETTPLTSRQILWVVFGIGLAIASQCLPYKLLRGWALPLYLVALGLLIAVYFFPPRNGSRRWIPLGLFDFQPSELAKLAYTLALGEYLMFQRHHRSLWGLLLPFLMTLVPVVLVLREPDLGTALLFFPVLFAVLFAAGARVKHLLAAGLMGVACVPVLWSLMSLEQKSRVTAVFQQRDDGLPQAGDGYHLYQSKLMLTLGGPWGSEWSGLPVSDPAAYRLPAARTDFVFCLIGERWGLAGTWGVLLLFSLLIASGFQIAAQTRDPFGRLLVTGVIASVAVQAALNMAMTVGVAPITGVTLPLVSYGGSSLIFTLLSLALVLNVGIRPGYDLGGQPFQFNDR